MEGVHLVATIVERILRKGICEAHVGTSHRKKSLITIVVACEAHVVHHHISLAITEICRIDRGNAIDQREDRTRASRVAFTTHIVRSRIGITDVGVEVEPIFRSPFGFQASSHTLEVGVFEDTLVVQVAHGEIDVAIVVALCYSEVVFLAQRGTISQSVPIIRQKGVVGGIASSVLTLHHTTELCSRVELSILEDEVLTLGQGVDHVAQTFLHILVGKLIGSFFVTEFEVAFFVEVFI